MAPGAADEVVPGRRGILDRDKDPEGSARGGELSEAGLGRHVKRREGRSSTTLACGRQREALELAGARSERRREAQREARVLFLRRSAAIAAVLEHERERAEGCEGRIAGRVAPQQLERAARADVGVPATDLDHEGQPAVSRGVRSHEAYARHLARAQRLEGRALERPERVLAPRPARRVLRAGAAHVAARFGAGEGRPRAVQGPQDGSDETDRARPRERRTPTDALSPAKSGAVRRCIVR